MNRYHIAFKFNDFQDYFLKKYLLTKQVIQHQPIIFQIITPIHHLQILTQVKYLRNVNNTKSIYANIEKKKLCHNSFSKSLRLYTVGF